MEKSCGPLVREENGRKVKNLKMREKRAKVKKSHENREKIRLQGEGVDPCFWGGDGPPGKGEKMVKR